MDINGAKSNHHILAIDLTVGGGYRWSIINKQANDTLVKKKRQIYKSGVIKPHYSKSISENMINLEKQLKEICHSEDGSYTCLKMVEIEKPIGFDKRIRLALLCGLIAGYRPAAF